MHFKVKRIFLPLVVYSFFLAVKRKKNDLQGAIVSELSRAISWSLIFLSNLKHLPEYWTIFLSFLRAGTRFIPVVSKFKKID